MSGKECSTCKETKSKHEFSKTQYKKPKWQRMCTDCQNADRARVGTINQMKNCRSRGKKTENEIGNYLDGCYYVWEHVKDTEG